MLYTVLWLALASGVFACPLAAQAHPAPTGLEASDGDYSAKVGLSWEHIRGAATYRIFRGSGPDPASATAIGTTESIIYYDEDGAVEQRYFYWVRAENSAGVSQLSSPDEGFRAAGITTGFGFIRPLQPPPAPVDNPVTGAKVYLGKVLFWDEQLSSTRTVACGTCHFPRSGGSDPRSIPGSKSSLHPGFDKRFGTEDDVVGSPGVPRNHADGTYESSPFFGLQEHVTGRKALSVIDTAYADDSLFWDGRAENKLVDPLTGELAFPDSPLLDSQALESQALFPLVDEIEMAHEGRTWEEVVARVVESQPLAVAASAPPALAAWIGDRSYPELFAEAFGTPDVTPVKMALAIASYERTLYSDRVPIDRYVSMISEEPEPVRRGRALIEKEFCGTCHLGSLVGDQRFHSIGVRPVSQDPGRGEVTGPRELGRFRTPNLRNAALRAPFMHNGGFPTLLSTIEFYDRGGDFPGLPEDRVFVRQLNLTDEEKADLVAFIKALTDPRVAAEAGPLFDRPILFSESARVPQIIGTGTAGPSQIIPQAKVIEPPLVGNPSFTVGLYDANGNEGAVLVIDDEDPGADGTIPERGEFFHSSVPVGGDGFGQGYASVSIKIPNNPELVGKTFVGRWYQRSGQLVSATAPFQFTIFYSPPPRPETPLLATVSAAGLVVGLVAPGSIVSGFAPNLSTTTEAASTTPLPTSLAGASVDITDGAGILHDAELFFVSPKQINYRIPAETSLGEATAMVRLAGSIVAKGTLQIASVAPGLFSANSNGRGPAAAIVLRVGEDGTQTSEPVAEFNQASNQFTTRAIDLSTDSREAFLVLFGTGVGAAGEVETTIDGESGNVTFAGPQGTFVGVDQINVRIPPDLAGRGEVGVTVTVNGQRSNAVTVRFAESK